MSKKATILITGAAGNLGSHLARHLIPTGHDLRLMFHNNPVAEDLLDAPNVTAVQADLACHETLRPAVQGADVVVHFAGVLFAPRPEKFLPETNFGWFSNLLDACLQAGVRRVILISFPHVEGPTSVEQPASGRLDAQPMSVHAQTRLEEERLLFSRCRGSRTTPVVLRVGMVYGPGILMIDAARWLASRRLLAVWREPTWIHLIATLDFLNAVEAAIVKPDVDGIYHVGDDQAVTLQHFLDKACRVWGYPAPRRLPLWLIYLAAGMCECTGAVARTRSPLTRDFIRIGQVSYFGDTQRAREQLIPELAYPTLDDGLCTLSE